MPRLPFPGSRDQESDRISTAEDAWTEAVRKVHPPCPTLTGVLIFPCPSVFTFFFRGATNPPSSPFLSVTCWNTFARERRKHLSCQPAQSFPAPFSFPSSGVARENFSDVLFFPSSQPDRSSSSCAHRNKDPFLFPPCLQYS